MTPIEVSTRPRILLVEDDPDQSQLLAALLEKHGFEPLFAPNGASALELLNACRPDAVVSDIRMPLLDGYQLCRLIKDHPDTADLPVILMTSYQDKGRRIWSRVCGADLFLVKEQAANDLAPKLRALLSSRPKAPQPGGGAARPSLELSLDAIQRRLAMALEHRLLESALRGAVAVLGSDYRDLDGMARGFLDLAQDLVPGGLFYLLEPRSDGDLLRLRGPASAIQGHGPDLERRFGKPDRFIQVLYESVEEGAMDDPASAMEFSLDMGEGEGLPACWGCIAPAGALAQAESELKAVTEAFRPLFSGARALVSLGASNALLREAGARQTLLLDTLSHELRSPITALRLREEQVLSMPGALSPLAAGILQTNQRVFDRLIRMLNGFLELEKLHQDSPAERVVLDLRAFLDEQVDDFRILGLPKRLEVRLVAEADCRVLANPDRLIQCLTNLVTNAIVHSPEDGEIRITLRAAGSHGVIQVQDQGPGVPAAFLGNLFQPFQQVQKREGGVGLGLAITAALARSMGCKVSYQPCAKGACFQLELELAH